VAFEYGRQPRAAGFHVPVVTGLGRIGPVDVDVAYEGAGDEFLGVLIEVVSEGGPMFVRAVPAT
jgi:hypothetical protein